MDTLKLLDIIMKQNCEMKKLYYLIDDLLEIAEDNDIETKILLKNLSMNFSNKMDKKVKEIKEVYDEVNKDIDNLSGNMDSRFIELKGKDKIYRSEQTRKLTKLRKDLDKVGLVAIEETIQKINLGFNNFNQSNKDTMEEFRVGFNGKITSIQNEVRYIKRIKSGKNLSAGNKW